MQATYNLKTYVRLPYFGLQKLFTNNVIPPLRWPLIAANVGIYILFFFLENLLNVKITFLYFQYRICNITLFENIPNNIPTGYYKLVFKIIVKGDDIVVMHYYVNIV